MTSEYRRFRASLLRRFSLVAPEVFSSGQKKQGWHVAQSFALGFLESNLSPSKEQSFEISLAKVALEIALNDGRDAALSVVTQFSKEIEQPTITRLITQDGTMLPASSNAHLCDRYLFGSPHFFEEAGKQKRNCYEDLLRPMGIEMPFDKRSMTLLIQRLKPDYRSMEVSSFDGLRRLVQNFVQYSWPLFEKSVLDIQLNYFDFDCYIPAEKMKEHFQQLREYGFERLQARLIVLRAVCDDIESREMISQTGIIDFCGYSSSDKIALKDFLDGNNPKIDENYINSLDQQNAIQYSTFLIIYLRCSASPFEFLQRLIFVYEKDIGVLCLMDWSIYKELIKETRQYYTVELVAMAAIFSDRRTLTRSRDLRNVYIPTGAGTDLLNFARHSRLHVSSSPFRFFLSLSKLPPRTSRRIFAYLISPGVIDRLVNVFPSETKLLDDVKRNDAVNALSLKLDCLSFIKRRKLLPRTLVAVHEEETRQRLRQVKYEKEVGSGRIRLDQLKLSQEVLRFIKDEIEANKTALQQKEIEENHLRSFLLERRRKAFCEKLAHFVCFESRFAFDYLISHLRHNLLRYKLESAVDKAFHNREKIGVAPLKTSIEGELDSYCSRWLTIDSKRSFVRGLIDAFFQSPLSLDHDNLANCVGMSSGLSQLAVDHFQVLLLACQTEWQGVFRQQISEAVDVHIEVSELTDASSLREKLSNALDDAFKECEKWMNINENPMSSSFGLKELFLFESTNFSSAKTRLKPITVRCLDARRSDRDATIVGRDVHIAGHYFDACVQLVHNLLENAFAHSGLPISDTDIDVSIYQLAEGRIRVEFRNAFDPNKMSLMQQRLSEFNAKAQVEMGRSNLAPIATGGSGLKRIIFEFQSVPEAKFTIRSGNSEFRKRTFLVMCEFSLDGGSD